MSTLETFADKVRNDTQRASQLKRAIDWLDRCGDSDTAVGSGISVNAKVGGSVAGYTDAMTLINEKLQAALPAVFVAVRQDAATELRSIEERYAPLMSQRGDV